MHGSSSPQTGQWDCALLHARYAPDRTGYGQTVDIWSWKRTPGLSPTFGIPPAHAEAEGDLEAQPVDYRTERLTPKEKERASSVSSTRQKTVISNVGAMSVHDCARRWNSHFLECPESALHRIYSKSMHSGNTGWIPNTTLLIIIKNKSVPLIQWCQKWAAAHSHAFVYSKMMYMLFSFWFFSELSSCPGSIRAMMPETSPGSLIEWMKRACILRKSRICVTHTCVTHLYQASLLWKRVWSLDNLTVLAKFCEVKRIYHFTLNKRMYMTTIYMKNVTEMITLTCENSEDIYIYSSFLFPTFFLYFFLSIYFFLYFYI